MTVPAPSCGTAMGCRTGTGCCPPACPLTVAAWSGWWPPRCRPPAPPAVSGSMILRCASARPPLVVHIKPVSVRQMDFGARYVAALVLITEPGRVPHIDPVLVATALGLTPVESQMAVWLAEGKTVREIAGATGRTAGSVYWHLNRIYRKQGITRQADLVRLVLSVATLA